MTERGLLGEILRRIAGSGRRLQQVSDGNDLVQDCRALLQERSEAAGLVRAQHILHQLDRMTTQAKVDFLRSVAENFGVDDDRLQAAIADWTPGDLQAARKIHFAAEPESQNLIRLLNRVPGATARLVALRADLIGSIGDSPALNGLDADFQHLFGSWFNRGFLEIRRIDWSTPAEILEKIIAYEAVHEFSGWDDLRQRVADPDRRLFAFFHPAMASEPLIFVQVALTKDIPSAIAPILSRDRQRIDPEAAKVAVFYSISNCQKGLRGISFGNFLIKQVVVELQRVLPQLDTFVTLSPVPGLRDWVERGLQRNEPILTKVDRQALAGLGQDDRPEPQHAAQLAARYLTRARRSNGFAFDPVANFHLSNGAELHAIHAEADLSARGLGNSWGVMVNYLYDGARIEANHRVYATSHDVTASAEVRALAAS